MSSDELPRSLIAHLVMSESGSTSVEYGAIASIISIAAIGGMAAVGIKVFDLISLIPSF